MCHATAYQLLQITMIDIGNKDGNDFGLKEMGGRGRCSTTRSGKKVHRLLARTSSS